MGYDGFGLVFYGWGKNTDVFATVCAEEIFTQRRKDNQEEIRLRGGVEFGIMNKKKLEDGSWKLEVGSWKKEVGSWKLEEGSWKLEEGSWKKEVGSWKKEVGSWKLEVGRRTQEGNFE